MSCSSSIIQLDLLDNYLLSEDDIGGDLQTVFYRTLAHTISKNKIGQNIHIDINYLTQCFTELYQDLDENQDVALNKWIAEGGYKTDYKKRFQPGYAKRILGIPILFKCDYAAQYYGTDVSDFCLSKDNFDQRFNSSLCRAIVNIRLILNNTKQKWKLNKLKDILDSGKIVPCTIYTDSVYELNRKFGIEGSTENSVNIIWTYDGTNLPFGDLDHAVTLIGYDCDGDYIEWIFQDTFRYPDNRPNSFIYRTSNTNLNIEVPWSVGAPTPFKNDITWYDIQIINTIPEFLSAHFNECCQILTPTPTIATTDTPTPTTPTPTINYFY